MAESVDALVSNTSGATRAGSTPALGTSSVQSSLKAKCCRSYDLQHFFLGPNKSDVNQVKRGLDALSCYTHSGIEQELARIRQIMKAALERNPEKSA